MRLPAVLIMAALALATPPEAAAVEVHLDAVSYAVTEGGTLTVTVVRGTTSGASPDGSVRLQVTGGTATPAPPGPIVMPGSDYQDGSIDVTWAPLDLATSKTVLITTIDDALGEGDETFTVSLVQASSGIPAVITAPSTASVRLRDTDPATVTGWSPTGGFLTSATATIVATFSEDVTIDQAIIGVSSDATLLGFLTDARTLTVNVGGLDDGDTVTITIPAGAVGDADVPQHFNPLITRSYTVDRTAPTATISGTTPTTTSPIVFTLAFSEGVQLATPGGMLLSTSLQATNGTITMAPLMLIGPTPVATVNVVPNGTGPVTLTVPAGLLTDLAGNPLAMTTGSVAFTDNIAPTVNATGSDSTNGTYGHGADIDLTVTFSEIVTLAGGPLIVQLNNGESVTIPPFAGQTQVHGTYHVGPAAGVAISHLDVNSMSLGIAATLQDRSGNAAVLPMLPAAPSLGTTRNIAIAHATPATYAVSTTTPAGSYGPFDGSAPINLTLTFSKPVSLYGHGVGILVNARSSVAAVLINPSPTGMTSTPATVWATTYSISPGDAASPLAVTRFVPEPMSGLTDSDGLILTTTTPFTNLSPPTEIVIDGVAPTVTSLSAIGSTTTSPVHLAVTLSEPSTDFTMSDITVSGVGGTLSNFAGSGASYTADVTPTAAGVVTLQITAGQFHDARANPSVAKSVDLTYAPAGGSGAAPASSSGSAGGCGVGSGIGALALLCGAMLLAGFRRRG